MVGYGLHELLRLADAFGKDNEWWTGPDQVVSDAAPPDSHTVHVSSPELGAARGASMRSPKRTWGHPLG